MVPVLNLVWIPENARGTNDDCVEDEDNEGNITAN